MGQQVPRVLGGVRGVAQRDLHGGFVKSRLEW